MAKKNNIKYQENYIKGCYIDKKEIKRIIDENFDKIVIEIRQRTIYSDDKEGILIEIKL